MENPQNQWSYLAGKIINGPWLPWRTVEEPDGKTFNQRSLIVN
jgi:hypothetical protein